MIETIRDRGLSDVCTVNMFRLIAYLGLHTALYHIISFFSTPLSIRHGMRMHDQGETSHSLIVTVVCRRICWYPAPA